MGVSYTGPGPMVTYLNSRQMAAPSHSSASPIGALQGTRMGVPVSTSYSQQQQPEQQHVNWSLASTIAASSSGSGVTSPLSSSSRGEASPALSGQGQGHPVAYMPAMPSLTPVSYDTGDMHYSNAYSPVSELLPIVNSYSRFYKHKVFTKLHQISPTNVWKMV